MRTALFMTVLCDFFIYTHSDTTQKTETNSINHHVTHFQTQAHIKRAESLRRELIKEERMRHENWIDNNFFIFIAFTRSLEKFIIVKMSRNLWHLTYKKTCMQ